MRYRQDQPDKTFFIPLRSENRVNNIKIIHTYKNSNQLSNLKHSLSHYQLNEFRYTTSTISVVSTPTTNSNVKEIHTLNDVTLIKISSVQNAKRNLCSVYNPQKSFLDHPKT